MRDNKIGCLPVIRNGKLAGIVTERHSLEVAARLMEQRAS